MTETVSERMVLHLWHELTAFRLFKKMFLKVYHFAFLNHKKHAECNAFPAPKINVTVYFA